MAHEIETMFSVREKPWHYEYTKDKTKIIQEAPTAKEALIAAGLDWDVITGPIFDQHAERIHGYHANIRATDKKILGVVSDRYEVIQNTDAFEFTDSLVGTQLKYETAGSLRGGKQIWLLGKLPSRTINGDEIEPYICFTNSHDGMGAVKCCLTPVRVVCNNTLNFALNGARRVWASNHIGRVQNKLDEARHVLHLTDCYLQNLEELGENLANEKMSKQNMEAAVHTLIPMDKDMSDKSKETVQAMRDGIMICTLAPDLAKFAGTKWQFVNAVADYVDHAEPFRKAKNWQANRWAKIMTGGGLLDRALDYVQNMP